MKEVERREFTTMFSSHNADMAVSKPVFLTPLFAIMGQYVVQRNGIVCSCVVMSRSLRDDVAVAAIMEMIRHDGGRSLSFLFPARHLAELRR